MQADALQGASQGATARAGRLRGVALRIGAAALLLFAISWFVDLRRTFDVLFAVSPVVYGACAAILFVQSSIAGLRWHIVAKACDVPLPAGAAVRIFLIGQFFGQFLPSSVGGDAIRILMGRPHARSIASAVSMVVNDRLMALVSAVLLITLVAPLTLATIATDQRLLGIAVGGVLAFYLGLALVLAFGTRVFDYLERFRLVAPVLPLARDFLALCRGRSTPAIVTLSLVVHVLMVAAIGLSVWGVGLQLSFVQLAAIGPWIVVWAMLPISVGNWGVREASMVIGLGLVGVPVEHALAASLTVAAGQIVVALIGMVFWLVAGAPRATNEDDAPAAVR
jgi:hypothetical protein